MALRSLLLITLVLAAAATVVLLAAAQQVPKPPTPARGIADGSAQRGLDRERARWQRLKIRNHDWAASASAGSNGADGRR